MGFLPNDAVSNLRDESSKLETTEDWLCTNADLIKTKIRFLCSSKWEEGLQTPLNF